MANNELTGLIKIAESLRIKGLGDVSQRDPAPFSKPMKRCATPYSNCGPFSSTSSGRPRKSARTGLGSVSTAAASANENDSLFKSSDNEGISSMLSSAGFAAGLSGLRSTGLSHLLETSLTPSGPILSGNASSDLVDHDSLDSSTPPGPTHSSSYRESKLRSCLEGQQQQESSSLGTGLPINLTSHLVGGFIRREMESREAMKKRGRKKHTAVPHGDDEHTVNIVQEKEDKVLFIINCFLIVLFIYFVKYLS